MNTVKTHKRHLYQKLGASSRTEAVERARAHGLLAPAHRLVRGPGLTWRARLPVAGEDAAELAAGADADPGTPRAAGWPSGRRRMRETSEQHPTALHSGTGKPSRPLDSSFPVSVG
jgi:hypothetical protein